MMKGKNKKIVTVLFSVFVLIYLFSFTNVKALVYNANEWTTFKNRTKEEIGQKYSYALTNGISSYRDGYADTYYISTPSLKSPYYAGELNPEVHTVMTNITNYYRWLVGVNEFKKASVTVSSEHLQEQALLRNFEFAHGISFENMPEDMLETDDVWVNGAPLNHNILAYGYSPRGSIAGWFDEGYILSKNSFDGNLIGHRVAILAQKHGAMNYGFSGKVAIGAIEDYTNDVIHEFIPYPAAGYMPLNAVLVDTTSWSVELDWDTIRYTNINDVVVKVTNVKDKSSYVCTVANGKLEAYDTYFSKNILFAQPDNGNSTNYYADGDIFKIEITGLKDASGDARIVYTTEFFDVRNYTTSIVTRYRAHKNFNKLVISNENNSLERLNQIAKILPNNITVTTDSGRVVELPVNGGWTVDMSSNCFKNSVDTKNLPEYIIDTDNILSDIRLNYDVVSQGHAGRFTVTPSTVDVSSSGEMFVHHYMLGTNVSKIYQITKDGEVIEKYNQDSSNHTYVDNGYGKLVNDLFEIDSYKSNDSGTYINLYYSDSYTGGSGYIGGVVDVDVIGDMETDAEIVSVEVESEPSKKKYKKNELGIDKVETGMAVNSQVLDFSGGKLLVTYNDGSNKTVDLEKSMIVDVSIVDSNSLKAKISYKENDLNLYFDLLNVESIEVNLSKNTFKVGDEITFSNENMILTYDDMTTEIIEIVDSMYSVISDNLVEFTYDDFGEVIKTQAEILLIDNPSQVRAVYGQKLSDVKLPNNDYGTYSWDEDLDTTVGDVGTNSFKVKFSPIDSKFSELSNLKGKIKVSKANPIFELPSDLTVEYGKKLKDIDLPDGLTWKYPDILVGDLGIHKFVVVYTPNDTKNYNVVECEVDVKVTKTIPKYEVFEDLEAIYGNTLGDIELPTSNDGVYSWKDATVSVGNVGVNSFKMIYTPNDDSYETVEFDVLVKVNKAVGETVVAPQVDAITYNPELKLGDIALPNRWSWDDENIVPTVGNSGYSATYTPVDMENYDYSNQELNITITVIVNKANPKFVVPTLISYADKTLADVSLPEGFSFNDDLNTSVGGVGSNTFLVTYTPSDTNNYEVVRDIEVVIEVEKAYPDFEVPTDLSATYGDLLSSIVLPERFSWNEKDALVGNVGVNEFYATYTPEDTDRYAIVRDVLVKINVNKKMADIIVIPTVDEITYNPNFKLGNIELPSGWKWEDESIVPTVDNEGYVAIYTPIDENNYDYSEQNLRPTIQIKVNKAVTTVNVPTGITIPWGTKLEEFILPSGFSFQDTGLVGEIGEVTFKVTYIPENVNYATITDLDLVVEVVKANPIVDVNKEITVTEKSGLKLSSIKLDNGWCWNNPNELVNNGGYFLAVYIPEDNEHYNTIYENIKITINKKEVTSNKGGNSTVNDSSSNDTNVSSTKDNGTTLESSDKDESTNEDKNLDEDDDEEDEDEETETKKKFPWWIVVIMVVLIAAVIAFKKAMDDE